MLRSADMSNTIPDEKVVVTYVSYLCARLLDIRHESRAARVIQLAWRRHHLQKVHREFLVRLFSSCQCRGKYFCQFCKEGYRSKLTVERIIYHNVQCIYMPVKYIIFS